MFCFVNSGAAVASTAVITTTAVKSEPTELPAPGVTKEETQIEVKEQTEPLEQAVLAAAASTTATVTVLDNAEKEKLTKEIAKLQEEIENNKAEANKYKEELEKEKQHILSLEEENSHLGKEKMRFEKQATDNKQVCERR